MKRWFAAVAAVVFASVSLHADVTVTSILSVEGGPPGASARGPMQMVMRVKGMKSRTEVDVMGQPTVIISDLAARKIYTLNTAAKTVTVIDATSPATTPAGAPALAATIKPSGQSRSIIGLTCDEHLLEMTIAMAEMSGAQMPPEAAEMMKGLTMAIDGSIWVAKTAPGAAEYAAFTQAAVDANLVSLLSGAPGKPNPSMERLLTAIAQAQGLPCLTEMNMTVKGTGPVADMMRQAGGMKTSITTTSISTDAIPDELFAVPADYKTVPK